ncbi:autotransporter assembly complex protein TamA [Actibacterium sp. D379-3]
MRVLLILGVSLVWAVAAQAAELRLDAPGASDGMRDNLRAASLTFAAAQEDGATPQDLLAAARADYARLVGVLYAAGFYSPVIRIAVDGREATDLSPYAAPDRIGQIVLRVEQGPRFVFSQARVAPLAPGTELPEGFSSGHTAHSTLIRDAAQAGVGGWRDAGHAKAALTGQRIVADHRAHTLAADIGIDPGPRLTFGDLLIEGKSRVRPARIRAIAGLPKGEVFSPDALARSATRLRRSGAFRSVALSEGEVVNADGSLDITAALIDEKKRRLGVGLELSSFEGLAISTYWLHRNLMRGAERFRFDAAISGIGGDSGGVDYSLGASLLRPATFNPDTSLRLSALLEELDEPDYFERKASVGIGLTRQFSDRLTVGAEIGLRYSDVEDDLGGRNFSHVLLPLTATWDGRDNMLNPESGLFLDTVAEPFVGLSGSASGGRLFADGRGYYGVGVDDRVILAGRVQAGSVIGAGLTEVPPDMLFFSGGGGTVRGQPYQELGIDLPGGERVGGRSFLGLSAEVRVGVTDTIGLVGFADAGFIGADSVPGADGDWHSGAGLGLRYNTGIGPIRLDIAAPVGGDTGEGVQIYVGIGQAF